jgi:hypothetical protein
LEIDFYHYYQQYFHDLGTSNPHGDILVCCPDEIHRTRKGKSDTNPSLSINMDNGLWKCFSCGASGDVYTFYQEVHKVGFTEAKSAIEGLAKPPIPRETIDNYKRILHGADTRIHFLETKRGLHKRTIEEYDVGFDGERYTIPIKDHTGSFVNIRRYDPGAKSGDKVRNIPDRGTVRLFPWSNVLKDPIVLVGGEMDCLLANQMGLNAMTTTAGELSWHDSWNRLFIGKTVYIMYDKDDTGRRGAKKVAHKLIDVAKEVKVIDLPIKEGEDFTDYVVNYGCTSDDISGMFRKTPAFVAEQTNEATGDSTVYSVHLSQASRGEYFGKRVKFQSIVAGKDLAPYLYPRKIKLTCSVDAGDKCAMCHLGNSHGSIDIMFKETDSAILHLIGVPEHVQKSFIKYRAGVGVKCGLMKMEVVESENVEEVILIPELDFSAQEQEYVARRSFYVGHGLGTNRSYEMYALTVPHPFTQQATHLIYEAKPSQDDISSFKMTQELYQQLADTFQTQDIKKKFDEIHEDLMYNVTKIYGRSDVLTALDLVYHSALAFVFQEKRVTRGWCECLILGDPRSGKTESAQSLIKHYRLGEYITGENSSYAGLIGGMQQHGRKWTVTWGKIPLNDRRLVIIDEVSGLSEDALGNMSGVRSSGVAEITKIQTERTNARTRIIWMSNPRAARTLGTYAFGVQAVRELIGRPEDIARFDFAVTTASDEVPAEVINARSHRTVHHRYTSQLCKSLILWGWSRKAENITFHNDAVEAILEYAIKMGKVYSSQIPLVEAADQRIKLARLAVAVAVRVFSTTDGEMLDVRRGHVDFAYQFLEACYRKASLGYLEFSLLQRQDEHLLEEKYEEIHKFVSDYREAMDMFMRYNSVKPRDLEDMLDMDRDTVRVIVQLMTRFQLVTKTNTGLIKRPHFIKLMKSVYQKEKEEPSWAK